MEILGKVLVYGDIHLCSKAYGAHKNYPEESLHYFSEISRVAEEEKATHIIGTGDLTYGRFHTLEYRDRVEAELHRQFNQTKGNRYELKGNHDSATNGMTEYEFYTKKGLIKPAINFDIGNVHFSLVDYGKVNGADVNVCTDDGHVNFMIAHDYLKFKDTKLPNFGNAVELDRMSRWYGVDVLICGHVHKQLTFKGAIEKDGISHEMIVHYPGCMSRPAYDKELDTTGQVDIITIFTDGSVKYDTKQIELWSIEESFAMQELDERYERKEEKEGRVDISEMVKQLDSHDRTIGNPEDTIMSMVGVDDKYKLKAVQLLREA